MWVWKLALRTWHRQRHLLKGRTLWDRPKRDRSRSFLGSVHTFSAIIAIFQDIFETPLGFAFSLCSPFISISLFRGSVLFSRGPGISARVVSQRQASWEMPLPRKVYCGTVFLLMHPGSEGRAKKYVSGVSKIWIFEIRDLDVNIIPTPLPRGTCFVVLSCFCSHVRKYCKMKENWWSRVARSTEALSSIWQ